MTNNKNEYISILADQLRKGNVIVFLGAGISRTFKDEHTGKEYRGLPSAKEIVKDLADSKEYIEPNMRFDQALFMVKLKEGRNEVERILEDYIDVPTLNPLPAHQLLADMSFSAFITTNYDQLLEKALEKNKKKFYTIIEDKDICRWRSTQLPYIKLHGCITRPKTIIAAEDEYRPISESKPIVSSLFKTLLANKNVLFLGFSLTDYDFKELFQELKLALDGNMPKSYAVVYEDDNYQTAYWKEEGINIINSDLTSFLRELFKTAIVEKRDGVFHPKDDWMNNIFFERLHEIRTSPSETQAIDAFLEHLLQEMRSPALSCNDIYIRASNAVDTILKSKPNFQALKKMWQLMSTKLETLMDDQQDLAEEIITDIIDDRKNNLKKISKNGKAIIEKGSCILVYSQSIQMLELLKSVSKNVQDSCKLFVCECRPKSPNPFQDGIAICEYLKDTGYNISLIPDVSVGNLLARNQVNLIMMGAHSIYFRNDEFVSYVNTCGTNMISLAAEFYNVPIYIIAESNKIIHLNDSEQEIVSYEEEENIFGAADIINSLHLEGISNVTELNIGYDLCVVNKNTQLITD